MCHRGAVLLEVVLALTLFVSAATIIGAGLSASARSAAQMKVEAQLADLAETEMSEVQMGLVEQVDAAPTPYEAPLQDWTWQVACHPVEGVEGLNRITVTVAHKPTNRSYSLTQIVAGNDAAEANSSGAESAAEPAGNGGGEP